MSQNSVKTCEISGLGKWLEIPKARTLVLEEDISTLSLHEPGEDIMWEHREKVALCKPRREPSSKTEYVGIFTLDLEAPEQWEKKKSIVKPTQSVAICYGGPS